MGRPSGQFNDENCNVASRKKHFLVQIADQLFLKLYSESYGEFSEPSFSHNFAQKKIART